MDGRSLHITAENIARLQQLFPDAVSEGRVDFDRLRAALGTADALAPAGPDHYELRWAGKSAARREVQRPTTATLLPDAENSVDWDRTGHAFIEGENLEVLRVLQRGYFGKVKLIYIDPPYNTGSDAFVYPDDYGERREDYEKAIGQRDENGFLNKQDLWKKNTRESGQYHSAWLSMMWPRLYLSRNLLREDGVIFVSIDDHEVHNLRLLLNEVFGEENFVGQLVWHKKRGKDNSARFFSAVHEYILVYAKNIEQLAFNRLELTEETKAAYRNPDNDPRGVYRTLGLWSREQGGSSYEYTTLAGAFFPKQLWLVNAETMRQLDADKKLINTGKRLYRKMFIDENKGSLPETIWLDASNNANAKEELKVLFGDASVFDTPKPVKLLEKIINVSCGKDDLVLDFFAGSGSTAQAVMALNEQDGGNRRFVLVQMPELLAPNTPAFQAGYRTIADITRARLAKAGAKLRAARAGQLALGGPAPDLGFRAYRLDYSNFRAWRPEVAAAPDLLAQLELFQEPRRDGSGAGHDGRAMLTELLLKMAGGPDVLPLSVPVARLDVAGVEVHDVAGGLVWLALAGINAEVVAAAVAARPQRLVVPGHLFAGPNPDELVSNARLQLADAGVVLQLI